MPFIALAKQLLATRTLTYYGENREGNCSTWDDIRFVETKFNGHLIPLPTRPFVMPCRSLCGLDLKRPHLTCFTFCRIRRVYYGKMPAMNEVEGVYRCIVLKNRRFKPIKDALFKLLATWMEICAN
jgi:hypothetical protein